MKKVLFIQHASAFGGSAMSLLYTLQALKQEAGDKYTFVVALAKWNERVAVFYKQNGFDVIRPDRIDTYEHTQALFYKIWNPFHLFKELKQILLIPRAIRRTKNLLNLVKPDIVHLNSVVLLGSALAVKKQRIPLIWHVREPSVHGVFGFRKNILIHFLKTLPNKVLFICRADQKSWGTPSNSIVVYNFVNFKQFNKNLKVEQSWILENKILKGDLNILFLGGVSKIKGGIYLIKALRKLQIRYPKKKIVLVAPGLSYKMPDYLIYKIARKLLPVIGLGTHSQKIEKEIKKLPYPEHVVKLPYLKNIEKIFSIIDVLVFPSIRPHFARPVIEAGAMSKPVIGSRLDGVKELIIENKNGFLVSPKSETNIEEKLEYFLNNRLSIQKLGEKGYRLAKEKYDAKTNIQKIIDIYEMF